MAKPDDPDKPNPNDSALDPARDWILRIDAGSVASSPGDFPLLNDEEGSGAESASGEQSNVDDVSLSQPLRPSPDSVTNEFQPGSKDEDELDFSLRLDPMEASEERTRSQRPRFPKTGEQIAGFRIVRELGRGAFARVYLAEQIGLAHRPVALKVATYGNGDESQLLARLQHAHIVPILSEHEDPETGLHLLCMPYFGGANLAQVLEAAGRRGESPSRSQHPTHSTGGSLVAALDQVGGGLPATSTSPISGRSGRAPTHRPSSMSSSTRSNQYMAREGLVALQVHRGPKMEVYFRNLRLKRL